MNTLLRAAVTALAAIAAASPDVAGHGPDPLLGDVPFGQDQRLEYRWRSGQVPPDWMRAAISAATVDSNNPTRRARTAVLVYDSGGHSQIAYDEPTPCGTLGAACTNRSGAPDFFNVWHRRQGYPFDWGAMRWCEAYDHPPDGCYEAEAITLHEFGHVHDLGHHVMYGNQSDFFDSVMEPVARTKPRAGFNAHRFGPCDVATLQRLYDVFSSSTWISTCLSVDTYLTFSASSTSIQYQGSVTFTAGLRVVSGSAAGKLSSNFLNLRDVAIQRRVPGGTWVGLGYMDDLAPNNGYTVTEAPTTTYEWRAVFPAPDEEGLQAAVSPIVRVNVAPCSGNGCPTRPIH